MATRGFENMSVADVQKLARKSLSLPAKPSKYRNQRCVVGGESFDSKREAGHWLALKAREAAGEIDRLVRQVPFALHCPSADFRIGAEVCVYIADFCWRDRANILHVADSKGVRTQVYNLKKKWMRFEHSIEIEEL